jgi:hypothetical protein
MRRGSSRVSVPWSKDAVNQCAYSAARLLFNLFSIAQSTYSFDLVFDGIWVKYSSGSPMYPFWRGFFFDICLLLQSQQIRLYGSWQNIDQDSLRTSLYWWASPFCQDKVRGAANATRDQTQAL